MFTGIVEETGVVQRIARGKKSIRLTIQVGLCGRGARLGDSISVNGCCLTVVSMKGKGARKLLAFDLLVETWNKTNLQFLANGALVNLERSLPANGRLGGHFVTGHIDGTGKISRWERSGQDHILEIAAASSILRYVVYKGSIAVDGMSLTVAGVNRKGFRIWIIPHTFEVTALKERKVGDLVNLEADILAKYVESFTGTRTSR